MKKGIEWVKNHWFTAGIIAVFLVVAGGIFAVLMGWRGIITPEGGVSEGDLLRSLILCIGAIGGVYGLHLAAKRQNKFSEQVEKQSKQVQVLSEQVKVQSKQVEAHVEQVQVLSEQVKVQADQSFNERLGRGVELLADEKNVVMRCAGVSILVDLAHNATDAQKPIVGNIIYDFFREKLRINLDHNGKCVTEKVGQDVQNILDFIIATPLDEREKLFPNRLVNGILDFCNLNFSHLHFTSRTLQNIDFSNSNFCEAKFKNNEIINVCFYGAKIEFSKFGMDYGDYLAHMSFDPSSLPPKVIICDCEFSNTFMEHTIFCNMSIEHTEFSDITIREVTFDEVEFFGGRFYCRHHITLSENSKLPYFVGTCFASAKFTFSNGLKADDFFKSCYYNVVELSPADGKKIGSTQGVEIIDEMLVFTKSGQPAEEQIAVEVAEWKLAQAGKSGKETAKLEKELAQAKRKLQRAQERLKKQQKKKPKKP